MVLQAIGNGGIPAAPMLNLLRQVTDLLVNSLNRSQFASDSAAEALLKFLREELPAFINLCEKGRSENLADLQICSTEILERFNKAKAAFDKLLRTAGGAQFWEASI